MLAAELKSLHGIEMHMHYTEFEAELETEKCAYGRLASNMFD